MTGGFSLGKEKAIVTGAALGMGRGISTVLAEEGYDIAFSYYPVAMLQERGARAWHFPADLTKPGAAEDFFAQAVDALGGLDLLVNNAGVNIPQALQDITAETFDYLISLDLRAYVMMMHCAARYMIDHGVRGCLINVSSSRGERAYPNAGVYCGIKACLNRMAEAFALDLADYGIRVNNVAPGAVRVRTDEELLAMKEGKKTDYLEDGLLLEQGIPEGPVPCAGTRFLGSPRPADSPGPRRHAGGHRQGRRVPRVGEGVVHHGRHAAGRRRADPARHAGRRVEAGPRLEVTERPLQKAIPRQPRAA